MALQKDHDVLDLPLFLPALFDPLHPNPSDSLYPDQRIRVLVDHIQRILPELLYDASGKFRANPLDQPGAEIFLNAVYGGRQRLFELFH